MSNEQLAVSGEQLAVKLVDMLHGACEDGFQAETVREGLCNSICNSTACSKCPLGSKTLLRKAVAGLSNFVDSYGHGTDLVDGMDGFGADQLTNELTNQQGAGENE